MNKIRTIAVLAMSIALMTTVTQANKFNWSEETNRVPISRNPHALYNDHWRDVMNHRVGKMQKQLNQAVDDEEKSRLATAILKNFIAQRQMRDMQRALDKPEDWTLTELEDFRCKLTDMMKIVREGRDPEIDMDNNY